MNSGLRTLSLQSIFGLAVGMVCPTALATNEPTLPKGLGGISSPLTSGKVPSEVMTQGQSNSDTNVVGSLLDDLSLSGFWEGRGGIRTQNDPVEDRATLGETRLQVRLEHATEKTNLKLTTDFLLDGVQDQHQHGLSQVEKEGYVDLREASIAVRFSDNLDVKAGRQILTWGTGDLIFINDLFPKDWVSFVAGRAVEYLKAPTTSGKISLFSNVAHVDLVYTPRFESDRYITGRRLSWFNPLNGELVGKNDVLKTDTPDSWFSDDELALRLYGDYFGYQFAAYGYRGFWKSPGGFDPTTGNGTFPDLSVYGFSVEGPIAKGIANMEFGYYDSRDDGNGDDSLIRNSEFRFLVGYKKELGKDFTLGLQYYLERMQNYGAYRNNLQPESRPDDKNRHVVTTRFSRLAVNQNLVLSLFAYYSPSDNDGYLRPIATYRVDDRWTLQGGANWFFGEHSETFIGQFEKNTNIYAAIRYNFSRD